MKKVFLVLGKSGSGKDTLLNNILESGELDLKRVIRETSRPRRTYEQDGLQYHFKTEKVMRERMGEYLEWDCFNDWFYATHPEALKDGNNFIMTGSPSTLMMLKRFSSEIELNAIFLNVSEDVQFKRLSKRGDSDREVNRRIEADNRDFRSLGKELVKLGTRAQIIDATLSEKTVFLLGLAFIGGSL